MKMVGHKTEAIYRRYAIVDEAMLREGAEKLERFQAAVTWTLSAPSSAPVRFLRGPERAAQE